MVVRLAGAMARRVVTRPACLAHMPGSYAGLVCRARMPASHAGPSCRPRTPRDCAGPGDMECGRAASLRCVESSQPRLAMGYGCVSVRSPCSVTSRSHFRTGRSNVRAASSGGSRSVHRPSAEGGRTRSATSSRPPSARCHRARLDGAPLPRRRPWLLQHPPPRRHQRHGPASTPVPRPAGGIREPWLPRGLPLGSSMAVGSREPIARSWRRAAGRSLRGPRADGRRWSSGSSMGCAWWSMPVLARSCWACGQA